MTTTVGCRLELFVETPAEAVLSVAVVAPTTSESLVVEVDGLPVDVRELSAVHGTRLQVADLPVGRAAITYDAVLEPVDAPRPVDPVDAIHALRPSRYCPSDLLSPVILGELDRGTPVAEVASWVQRRLTYDVNASRPVDSALDTLLTGRGVCRDYAHLLIATLRALEVPARLVSVYAPGLWPMDFHAVVEAAVDGTWQLFDATGMAPRPTMVRIATGQDAAGTAFVTTSRGVVVFGRTEVLAWTDSDLPQDAPTALA